MNEIPTQQLFKWIGGKKWLGKTLEKKSKIYINDNKSIYIEPFLGGMGSFLSIYQTLLEKKFKIIILNDINTTLINLLENIKKEPYSVINKYIELEEEFLKTYNKLYFDNKKIDKETIKIYLKNSNIFFGLRKKEFNTLNLKKQKTKEEIERTNILFLFLMKNCFNGIYRENLKGEFNTPFNWTLNKYMNIEKTITEYHNLFNNIDIVFENLDVFELLEKYKESSEKIFLYIDPPYLNEGENENKYNKEHFNYDKQKELLKVLGDFDNYIYSNHSLPIFKEHFKNYIEVNRKNIMSSKGGNRKNDIKEILSFVN